MTRLDKVRQKVFDTRYVVVVYAYNPNNPPRGTSMIEQYREDGSGSVYEYDDDANGYLFIGKLNGLSLKQFIIEYEDIA